MTNFRLVIAMALLLGMAGMASAAISIGDAPGTEANIYTIYNDIYNTTYATNADLLSLQNDAIISSGLYSNILQVYWVARYAADEHELSTYNPSDPLQTYGPLSLGALANETTDTTLSHFADIPLGTPSTFGFKLVDTNTSDQWFSQKGYNIPPDNAYHFLVLNGNDGSLLVGVEDKSVGSDWDYNDVVYKLAVAPEPVSTALFLLGGMPIALSLYRKRKHAVRV